MPDRAIGSAASMRPRFVSGERAMQMLTPVTSAAASMRPRFVSGERPM